MSCRREIRKCDCGCNINLNIIKYDGGINDIGYWNIRCNNCNKEMVIKVYNPNDSSIISGGVILGSQEKVEREDYLNIIQVFENDEEDENDEGECNSFSLAVCPKCNKRIDYELSLITEFLFSNTNIIQEKYIQCHNTYVKNWYGEIENIITYIPVKCDCGYRAKAIFGSKFSKCGDTNCLLKQNLLGIKELDMEVLINGIYSKTECMNIIERLALRWNFIANNIYIAINEQNS